MDNETRPSEPAQIPLEVVREILLYLDHRSLIAASQICKNWQQIIDQGHYWNHLCLHDFNIHANSFHKLHPKELYKVSLKNYYDTNMKFASYDDFIELSKVAIKSYNYIFINEYIYESMILDLSGRLIYEITKSQVLSFLGKMVSYVVPSLRANTFGVGVRFRSNKGWTDIFDSMGFKVVNFIKGAPEPVSFARRLLLIRECRRDSFLLTNK